MTIKFERFTRVIHRCIEIRKQPDIDPIIITVYDEALAQPAGAYLGAVAAITAAASAHRQKKAGVAEALALLNAPYKTARSALKALHPEYTSTMPRTLKALTTDTDKRQAIVALLGAIQKHAGAPWADALLSGDFGAKAPAAVALFDEMVTASSNLARAKADRAAAFGPAYDKYLDFKSVVREARGARSVEYRRIHLRASPGADKRAQDGAAAEESSA
jgi:hypothetical protein